MISGARSRILALMPAITDMKGHPTISEVLPEKVYVHTSHDMRVKINVLSHIVNFLFEQSLCLHPIVYRYKKRISQKQSLPTDGILVHMKNNLSFFIDLPDEWHKNIPNAAKQVYVKVFTFRLRHGQERA